MAGFGRSPPPKAVLDHRGTRLAYCTACRQKRFVSNGACLHCGAKVVVPKVG